MLEEIKVVESSGNVFADLGLPDSDERLIKAELAHHISERIADRQLTQVQAAGLLGIDQPKISALVRGKLTGFSIERLFRFLNTLGSNIEIRVTTDPQSDSKARTRVVAG
ncbi:MAG: helix-turn-helix domain-containing protein [Thermosynechococcaceae cyanobacterium]